MTSNNIFKIIGTENLESASTTAQRKLLLGALDLYIAPPSSEDYLFIANSVQLAAFQLLSTDVLGEEFRSTFRQAFDLCRVLSVDPESSGYLRHLLRISCLGILADRGSDVARLLREQPWPNSHLETDDWGKRVDGIVIDSWLRLVRKSGWQDLERVQQNIIKLRSEQSAFEEDFLTNLEGSKTREAWRLVALYHLSKAAEILAVYTTQGEYEGKFDIRQQLDAQFDRSRSASEKANDLELENDIRLLAKASNQIVDNSIWTVTRAVNSRVSSFVQSLVSNKAHPIFEMLPPQRQALREEGLLGSSHRSIVINLPTSSGKTFIAQFRILQALNQFELERGWVAYLAPTRALVNQLTTKLRRDFNPIGINVERVSPALEIDSLEEGLLKDENETSQFRVLVTTPEKLDLMLRGGWEERIGRPLTLVVVDEAHNLAQPKRGLTLELLLATINRECRYSQFLLLTPFITNAAEIARWLSPDNYSDISLEIDWLPNDRAILISTPIPGESPGDFSLILKSIHTTRQTLAIPENLTLMVDRPLDFRFSDVNRSPGKLGAVTAQVLKSRGPVILLSGKVPHAWSTASYLMQDVNRRTELHSDVQLVHRFLRAEFGDEFLLNELLQYGVGVHHSGLSDEARVLMEWLFEKGHLDILVATTTIAQGVNFPVSGVVLASHQYPYGQDMPPEDFWNLAGRAGRVDQGSIGLVALAAPESGRAKTLEKFIGRSVSSLNSTLISLVQDAIETWGELNLHLLASDPNWSAFLQYLAHTYRQIDNHEIFALEVEQVLRGTLGFEKLRKENPEWANRLILAVHAYSEGISGKPLTLVDMTGFSWESVSSTLVNLAEENLAVSSWDPDRLFEPGNSDLRKMIGVLLSVPELRSNLLDAAGEHSGPGDRLSRIIAAWVSGGSIEDIAEEYFSVNAKGESVDVTKALTACCQKVYGRLTQTASWGLSALQSLTLDDEINNLSKADQIAIRNIPARVYYGVSSDDAIALRLLGVPRSAANRLAGTFSTDITQMPLSTIRSQLIASGPNVWEQTMGDLGRDYFRVWNILEGTTT